MKVISIIPIHMFLFLHCIHAIYLPKDDDPGILIPDHQSFDEPVELRLKWTPCNLGVREFKELEKNKAFQCSPLDVPLDYTNLSRGTTTLNLIMLKAPEKSKTEKLYKGSIIVNFGGPGTSGVQTLLQMDPNDTLSMFGGRYDIVSFDPRGTGNTLVPPDDNGTLTQMVEELIYTAQNSSYFLSAREAITEHLISDGLDYISTFTESFLTKDEARSFRGTAFVARDVAEIALQIGNRINYWGISYGTVVGQVLAGMFPDRIGRMLLDGNLLADDYVDNLGLDSTRDARKALYHFYDECMAAANNSCHSANKLPKKRDDFLEVLNRVFMVCTGVGGGLGSAKSLALSDLVLGALYNIDGYLWLDELIDTALEGNRSMCSQSPGFGNSTTWNPHVDLAYLAIWCSDATFRAETPGEVLSLFQDDQAQDNPFFLSTLLQASVCFRWNTHAAEAINLTSLSRVKTTIPILLVNGKYDPATALGNARKISARFPGSRVVVHEGVGHGFEVHSSNCTRDIVAKYFISDELPPQEVTCEPDKSVFELIDEKRKQTVGLAGKRSIPILLWNSSANKKRLRAQISAYFHIVSDMTGLFWHPGLISQVFLLPELVNRRLLSAKPTINTYQTSSSPTRSGGVKMSADILAAGGKASPSMGVEARNDNNGDLVTATEEQNLQRGLHERHLSMLGIAGAIGTGLFLGLGQSVQTGGPLGALLGYATVGLVVCAVQFALGEVAALLPVTGAFVRHAEFLVDPAWGFAIGWNLVYGNILSIPSEITAICVLFEFWTDINPSLWIMIFIVLTTVVGLCFVRVFGEVEFWFALLKILLVVFLIILGLVINLGGVPGTERIGFRYWKDPGPFVEYIASGSWGQFLGYWSVMTSAVFSFAGVESIAMAAAETRNPARAIPKACKNVFIRILVFYILAILIVGMLVRSDDERLNDQSGAAGQSPFVIAASAAGIPAIPSVVNAVVITSAWSASNQSLLAGTRVLYGLALKRQAPQIFLRTTAWGVPYVCVLFFTCFMFLSFMSLSNGAMTVFWWLVDLTAAGVLISWASILLNHIRLRLAMKKQGIPIEKLPWHNSWTFYSSCAGLFMTLLILLTGGFRVFTRGNWDPVGFVSSYLDIPLVTAAYLIWKFVKKTKVVPLAEIPLQDAFRKSEEDHEVVTA
ncbi:general amino acid permease [Fusarium pseudoanthophilum]|uniref:General amino acid permease n=1 Tax=Fusarium pseudoanthophilum TaxID=48495 RepID=A0A8H5UX68_9HYPO|nr:general amino acid permease [Fusarium pseudoanthophilum]